ncbi:hypothetical protein PLICRDRAFT_58224 [Plicaturopsis crispa FD-325 SS-3]|uniref:cAMP-independent regulatory protein pac2 n=1 Tax=Plicaturopsis crispa FD-325 SS-3 TaxID=944288 RepID=A0A0C9SKI0_PLICR|nr:hypothetical protein PLICRDRAFT_58224 [Plicaturopsis crispa FD-325 SS-3]
MAFYANPRGYISPNGPLTHPALHLRDANDAHILLEAVRLNILPLITRRLSPAERDVLTSGSTFVWEEAEDDGGLLRWTDGRRWSQSRMRGDYLFYEEKVETTQDEKDAKAARRAQRAADPSACGPSPSRRRDRPNKQNGLTKQTYSALVHLPGAQRPRRWHVVAYFLGNDYAHLPVVDNYEYLRNIRVPVGVFVSSKANSPKLLPCNRDRGAYYNEAPPYDEDQLPLRLPPLHNITSGTISSSSSSSSSPHMSHDSHASYFSPHQPAHSSSSHRSVAASGPPTPSHHPYSDNSITLNQPTASNYTPLSPEDRRVLSKFRVVL